MGSTCHLENAKMAASPPSFFSSLCVAGKERPSNNYLEGGGWGTNSSDSESVVTLPILFLAMTLVKSPELLSVHAVQYTRPK